MTTKDNKNTKDESKKMDEYNAIPDVIENRENINIDKMNINELYKEIDKLFLQGYNCVYLQGVFVHQIIGKMVI
jgi:hypothetical protein